MKTLHLPKVTNYLTVFGMVIWLSAFVPVRWSQTQLYWGAIATIRILPVLGVVILLLSICYQKLWTGLVSILFIIAFLLSFGLGYFLFGP